MIGKLLNKN